MKKLPKMNESFEELYRILIAPIKSKLLLTGIELKVFDQLSEQRSAEAVAKTLSALSLAKDDMDSLTKKIYDTLNPGGVFVVLHEGLTNERTKPDAMVLSMMHPALMGQDMCFDRGFIADSMLRVGFKSVRSRTLDTVWGPMDLDIGRK